MEKRSYTRREYLANYRFLGNSQNYNSSQLREHGGATLVALIAIAGMLFVIYGDIRGALGQEIDPKLQTTAAIVLGVIAVFSAVCAIHMRIIGSKPEKIFAQEIAARIIDTQELLSRARHRMKTFEEEMLTSVGRVPRKAADCLSMLKKITSSLETRIAEANDLVKTGNKVSMIEAYDLMRRDLIIMDDCIHSLLDSEPIPPLEPYQWEPTIDRLTSEIEHELRSIAA
ncbi:MAG: hypothetical protein IT291_10010 [Deltaproteobacteria bacterium]|nr:hypothetical protein [Deltaproteobacteria bacterium]